MWLTDTFFNHQTVKGVSKLKKLNGNTVGLILAVLMGLWHAIWALLVMVGLAMPILDWIYGLHFLSNPFSVMPFDMATAVMLVVFTAVVGYVVGWVFAAVWNTLKR